jgi:FixJ family two-component response regulator
VAETQILCVDDEPNVLKGLKLTLREYDVRMATSAAEGLELLAALGTVPVVISDMRMPQMSGAQFLQQVAAQYPMTSRILLTGAADVEAAVDAVNLGNLFRFLLKPCPSAQLRSAVQAAVEHHRIMTSERDLLQRTLVGSIRALAQVLAIADPTAFGRIGRLKELALAVAGSLGLHETWPIEYAALVCQLGNVTLTDDTARKLYGGLPTTVQERIQIEAASKLTGGIIRHIPRLEPVTQILEDLASSRRSDDPRLESGARILRLVLAYEAFERTSKSRTAALRQIKDMAPQFDPRTFQALMDVVGSPELEGEKLVKLADLHPGMVTAEEWLSASGVLVVAAGVEITEGLMARLMNFPDGYLVPRILVRDA